MDDCSEPPSFNEEEVYRAARVLLSAADWELVGGQAPGGSHDLPLIEIKDPSRTGRGSTGSYKPDLICYRDKMWLLVEAKPQYSERDREKLLGILNEPLRLSELAKELAQRQLLNGRVSPRSYNTHGALAYAGRQRQIPPLGCITVNDGRISSFLLKAPQADH